MAKQTRSPTDTSLSFEDIMSKLEAVVERLEDGELPLEASLAAFEEGVGLSRLGAERLDEAERRVEQLLANAKGVTTEPVGESENA